MTMTANEEKNVYHLNRRQNGISELRLPSFSELPSNELIGYYLDCLNRNASLGMMRIVISNAIYLYNYMNI